MSTQNEKWILTVKELHLGHCKETFRAGAVIELDEANGRLIIDGRRFNDTRDLDVLKRQSENNPDNPWVIPYSKEARLEIIQSVRPPVVPQKKAALQSGQTMQVIKSDQDLNEEIDISATQVSKVNAAAKQAARDKVKTNGMEIIRGDETVEERLAALRGKNDITSIAERARLKASGSTKMAVVRDDSLGAGFTGKNAVSLNAGQHLPSREEADARKGDAAALADARKKEAEMRRKASGEGEAAGDAGAQAEAPEAAGEAAEAAIEAPAKADPEKDALRAENAELKARMDRLEKMMVAQQGAAPKRGKKVGTTEE